MRIFGVEFDGNTFTELFFIWWFCSFLVLFPVLLVMARAAKQRERRNRIERLFDETRFGADAKAKKRFRKALGLIVSDDVKFGKASRIFKRIMNKTADPLDRAYCAQWYGKCREAGGDEFYAATFYTEAVRIAPSDVFALNRLANYYHDKDYEKSERYYRQSLEYDPTETRVYFGLGKLYSRNGEPEKAIKQYETAIAVNNGYVAPMAEAAIEYAKKGDKENCLKYYLLAMANDLYEFDKLEEEIKLCLSD
ncbi:MAG: tetratricopeptide repeat protein [Oscillospiraceae bacterium]|nr:tetratricopeptide repeat protein [Oscillospiraceae bacterium]